MVSSIFILLILFFLLMGIIGVFFQLYRGKLKKKEHQINELLKQVKRLRDQITKVNKRRGFRLDMADYECDFQFIELEDPTLQELKNREAAGKIKDISIIGMRIGCNYDLPLKNNITIKIEFKLQSECFSLQALLTRKEKHIDNPDVIYGMQFVEMSLDDNSRLLQCLKNIEIERRKRLN